MQVHRYMVNRSIRSLEPGNCFVEPHDAYSEDSSEVSSDEPEPDPRRELPGPDPNDFSHDDNPDVAFMRFPVVLTTSAPEGSHVICGQPVVQGTFSELTRVVSTAPGGNISVRVGTGQLEELLAGRLTRNAGMNPYFSMELRWCIDHPRSMRNWSMTDEAADRHQFGIGQERCRAEAVMRQL